MLEILAIILASTLVVATTNTNDKSNSNTKVSNTYNNSNTYKDSKAEKLHKLRKSLNNMSTSEIDFWMRNNYLDEYCTYGREYKINKIIEKMSDRI